jgi:hypothetical protein
MSEPNGLSYDEIIAELMANRKKPKVIPKPTPQQKADARFDEGKKPTEAILQDAIAANCAVTRRMGEAEGLAEEARKRAAAQRAFDAEQHRHTTDGAQMKNYMRAYRRQMEEASGPVREYYSRCELMAQSAREAEAAIRGSRISFHRGPGDPDW